MINHILRESNALADVIANLGHDRCSRHQDIVPRDSSAYNFDQSFREKKKN